MQALEGRRLLAGNVTVADVGNAQLLLTGDSKSNQIEVRSDLDAGVYVVTGLNGTTVNGGTDPVSFGQVSQRLAIDLGNGDDVADVSAVLSNLAITTGNGDDVVHVYDTDIDGDLSISTGNGADSVTLDNVTADPASIAISLGNGNDTLNFTGLVRTGGLTTNDGGNGHDVATGVDFLQALGGGGGPGGSPFMDFEVISF